MSALPDARGRRDVRVEAEAPARDVFAFVATVEAAGMTAQVSGSGTSFTIDVRNGARSTPALARRVLELAQRAFAPPARIRVHLVLGDRVYELGAR